MPFNVTDQSGQDINLKDEVRFSVIQDDLFTDGEERWLTGLVVSLNSETAVQVQPEEGPSLEVATSSIEVTSSLVNDCKKMATTEDMRKIIEKAETRFRDEVMNGTNKKKSGGTKAAAKPKKAAITGTLEL